MSDRRVRRICRGSEDGDIMIDISTILPFLMGNLLFLLFWWDQNNL